MARALRATALAAPLLHQRLSIDRPTIRLPGSGQRHAASTFGGIMKLRSGLAALTLTLACGASQAAVTSLDEGFDDINTLLGNGWALVNNSTPGGATSWFQGNDGVFPAYSGAPTSYIAANYNNAPFPAGGTISNWLVTPQIAFSNLMPTFLQFALRGNPSGGFLDTIQVYFSTTGNSVGNTTASTGDFTQIAQYDFPTDPGGWTVANIVLNPQAGPGYFAFRYFVADTTINGDYIGIDSVRIGVPEPASAALLMLGMAGLALARRRQRSA